MRTALRSVPHLWTETGDSVTLWPPRTISRGNYRKDDNVVSMGRKVAGTLTAFALAVAATVGVAGSASAIDSRCGVYPSSPTSGAGKIYFSSTTTCGTNAFVAESWARLEGTKTVTAPIKYSSGTTTLTASSSTSCTGGSYRTAGGGVDIWTSAAEKRTAYKPLSC